MQSELQRKAIKTLGLLTQSETEQGTFTLMSLLDQILSADFFQKFPNSFRGEN